MEHQSILATWEAFYVIIGTSAAALTGLQFVVIALLTDVQRRSSPGALAAYATPQVVHFGAVLLLSAILSAPWPSLTMPDILVGLLGVAGVVHAIVTTLRARRQTAYAPVLEDWIWHSILPFISYANLVIAALMLGSQPELALFLCGGSAVVLVFVGIHNAWDTATYLVESSQMEERAPIPAPPSTDA